MRTLLVVSIIVSAALLGTQFASAKEPTTPPAPLPTQIVTAKKIFISNAGGDNRDGAYNGGADRAYNQFYAAMKSWGHYELAAAPVDADLVFKISFTVPGGFEHGHADYDPQFQLVIFDPKTRITLWAFTEHADWAILGENRNRNFDQALDRIVADVKSLIDPTAATNRRP